MTYSPFVISGTPEPAALGLRAVLTRINTTLSALDRTVDLKADASSVPTKVSGLTNDTGYVTQAGARSALSVSGDLTYNAATGVLSYTLPAITSARVTDATPTNTSNAIVKRDMSGGFSAGTITASLAGNATTASKLYAARTISLSGDATGSVGFDGANNVSLTTTLAPSGVTAGSYGSDTAIPTLTVDAKGRLVGASSTLIAFPVTSVAGRTGAITLTKSDLGLGNVDNTSDATKAGTGNAIGNAIALRAPIASPGFTGSPTAPTPADGAIGTEIPTAAFIRRALSAIPLNRHGVVGDGSASDFDRLTTALAEMSETGLPLIPQANRDYRIGARIVLPARTNIRCMPGTTFQFYASDSFTSTSRPTTSAAMVNAQLIYAEKRDNIVIDGLRVIFHPRQSSYVHGLCISGGRNARISNFEASGFCSGYVLKLDSVTDANIFNPYIHDCLLDMPNGGAAAAQLSGICLDDDKILGPDGRIVVSTGKMFGGKIARLLATPATIAGPGYQTDGITAVGYPSDQVAGGFSFFGTEIEEVYEGVDCVSGGFIRGVGLRMKNIGYFGLKFIHGSHHCEFVDTYIDGVAKAAVVLSGSGSPQHTHHNIIRGLTVTRCADYTSGKMPDLGGGSILRIEDGGNGSSQGNARYNTITDVRTYLNGPQTYGILFDSIQPGTLGNTIGSFDHDGGFIAFSNFDGSSIELASRVALDLGRQRPRYVGDANVMMGVADRQIVLDAPLTAPRTIFLPRAYQLPAGTRVRIWDPKGCVSATNTLGIRTATSGADLMLPSGGFTLTDPRRYLEFETDGLSTWQRII